MAEERLNVVWIITDEQRTDSLGCYGSPWARSPHLDDVANAGVRFENCIVQSPVCVPSRTCMMTGRYAHSYGVLECLHRELPNETPLTQPFVDAGYQVAGFGKFHCVDPRNPFPIHGPEIPGPDGLGHGGPAASPLCLAEPYKPEEYDVVNMPFKNEWGPQALIVGGRYPLPSDQNEPALLAARCEQFLQNEVHAPFFLRASIAAPHTPVLPAVPFYGATNPDAIDLPDYDDAGGRPECCRYDREVLGKMYDFGPLSADQRRRARADYYDLCTEVDAAVGRILGALDTAGLRENTLVVFTSDHGNMLGEHGLMQKETFYEQSVRVPLLFSCPGRLPEDAVIGEPVETIDIMPTMLSMAGLDIPGNVHGVDLTSALQSREADPDRITFSEIDLSLSDLSGLTPNAGHRVMARTNSWKLVYNWTDGGFGEDAVLYDLANDPGEMVNLYGDERHSGVARELKSAIVEWQRDGTPAQ
jgi:arylsulfatase